MILPGTVTPVHLTKSDRAGKESPTARGRWITPSLARIGSHILIGPSKQWETLSAMVRRFVPNQRRHRGPFLMNLPFGPRVHSVQGKDHSLQRSNCLDIVVGAVLFKAIRSVNTTVRL